MRKRRVLSCLLTLALVWGLFIPMPARAISLYVTAINDSIPPLSSDTMPFWSGGILYVPYTVFDANTNGVGVSLGLYASFNKDDRLAGSITLYSLRQRMVFDVENGTCQDETGAVSQVRSFLRGGKVYLPLGTVCSHFGLEYSYNQLPNITQGYLVRIKSADAVLDDGLFIERARDLINNRLREYTQSLSPAESTEPAVTPAPPVVTTPPPAPQLPEENGSDTPTYLAFRCKSGESLGELLNVLDSSRCYGVFFLTPQVLEEEGDLVRRALGSGHSVGIWADGREGTLSQLAQGNWALEEAAHPRTTRAYVPGGQRGELEQAGWVCWRETLLLSPGGSVGATAFAGSVFNQLGKRRGAVYLTLEGDANTARVLSVLLRQLNSSHFSVSIPIETRL